MPEMLMCVLVLKAFLYIALVLLLQSGFLSVSKDKVYLLYKEGKCVEKVFI